MIKPADGIWKTACLIALGAALLGPRSIGAEVSPKNGLSIGVAPFERVGDLGRDGRLAAAVHARDEDTVDLRRAHAPEP